MMGSLTFIIVALRWTRSSRAHPRPGPRRASPRGSVERRGREGGRVDDLARQNLESSRSTVTVPSTAMWRIVSTSSCAATHDFSLVLKSSWPSSRRVSSSRGERLVAVRVRASVVLDRQRSPAVAVAFAQDRVDGGTLDAVVRSERGRPSRRASGARRGKSGDVVPLRLQFGDRGLQLRDRGRDVGQLDDVGLGRVARPRARQRIAHLLLGREPLRKGREDASREGDVTRGDLHAGARRDGTHDRKEGRRRQGRSLVGVRVDCGRIGHDSALSGPGSKGSRSGYRTAGNYLDVERVQG